MSSELPGNRRGDEYRLAFELEEIEESGLGENDEWRT